MKKLVCVVFITLALPVLGALSIHSRDRAQAFNPVALAGHSTAGGAYCDGPPCEHFPRTQAVSPAKGGNPSPVVGSDVAGGVLLALVLIVLAFRIVLRQ